MFLFLFFVSFACGVICCLPFLCRAEYGQHIDTVQNDLESLRELLKGEGYQLDANTLLGVSAASIEECMGLISVVYDSINET